jgi:hypothetical protein
MTQLQPQLWERMNGMVLLMNLLRGTLITKINYRARQKKILIQEQLTRLRVMTRFYLRMLI